MSFAGFLPGLPPLASQFLPPLPGNLLTDDVSLPPSNLSAQPQWGLFLNGAVSITADSVNSLDYKSPSEISDYPVEQGGFQSYNKVQLPFTARIRFVTGKGTAERSQLLTDVENAKTSLTLYDLVTPEVTKHNVNVTDYSYTRADGEGGYLAVDVDVEEIRQTVTAAFSSTPGTTAITNGQQAGSNDPVNDGTVAPGAATPAQQTTVGSVYQPPSGGLALNGTPFSYYGA